MPISFQDLSVGCRYDRPFLASLWGYKGWAALARGVISSADTNTIVLFITKDKQKDQPQYRDSFDGEVLRFEGEDGHRSDARLASSNANGDEVHLFYRDRHHAPFTYEGKVILEDYQACVGSASRFVFRKAR